MWDSTKQDATEQMYCVLLLNIFCTCALFSTAKPQAQWNYGLFPPVKCLSCPMRDARNTALCITSRLPFNYKFVVNVTALVHRNWNVTNLHCICHTSGGEKWSFHSCPTQTWIVTRQSSTSSGSAALRTASSCCNTELLAFKSHNEECSQQQTRYWESQVQASTGFVLSGQHVS